VIEKRLFFFITSNMTAYLEIFALHDVSRAGEPRSIFLRHRYTYPHTKHLTLGSFSHEKSMKPPTLEINQKIFRVFVTPHHVIKSSAFSRNLGSTYMFDNLKYLNYVYKKRNETIVYTTSYKASLPHVYCPLTSGPRIKCSSHFKR
jgi:hypothetical protein